MAFTVSDIRDLIQLLAQHPEWRAELRPLILGDEFDRLPEALVELTEAQRRTDYSLAGLAEDVKSLAQDVRSLTEVAAGSERRLQYLTDRVDEYVGPMYEMLFARKAGALFGPWLRRPRVVGIDEIERIDDAEASGDITMLDMEQLRALDLLVVGGDKSSNDFPETYVVVEVSRTIDSSDIQRSLMRAAILRKLGFRVLSAVGGREIRPRDQQIADDEGVIVRLVNQVA